MTYWAEEGRVYSTDKPGYNAPFVSEFGTADRYDIEESERTAEESERTAEEFNTGQSNPDDYMWVENTHPPKLHPFAVQADAILENDVVNHPAHYKFANGVEVIALTEQLNFNCGNVVKYTARAGRKDASKQLEDLRKAEFYIKREITRVERGD